MSKIKLVIKEGNTKETQEFEIDRVTTFQMLRLKTEIGHIMKELKGNGELVGIIEGLFEDQNSQSAESGNDMKADKADIQKQALEKAKDQRFINGLATGFDKILDTVPERAFNILSILSGIDADTLKKTYFDEIFDVYDAIMAENDIEKMVERIRKSFSGTKKQWGALLQKVMGNQN